MNREENAAQVCDDSTTDSALISGAYDNASPGTEAAEPGVTSKAPGSHLSPVEYQRLQRILDSELRETTFTLQMRDWAYVEAFARRVALRALAEVRHA